MNVTKIITFFITLALALGCFMFDISHNSFARLGIYEFVNPVLACVLFSLFMSTMLYAIHPAAIAVVLFLCLFANLPPSAIQGTVINQDVVFAVLLVVLFLPTAIRSIEQ